jgi:hypothetical protein
VHQDRPTDKHSNKHGGTFVITQKQKNVADIIIRKFNLCNNTSENSNKNYICVHKLKGTVDKVAGSIPDGFTEIFH